MKPTAMILVSQRELARLLSAMVMCVLFVPASSSGGDREAQINSVEITGTLPNADVFSVRLGVQEIGVDEINNRLKQLPLYGAEPVGTDPHQRAMKILQLAVKGKTMSVSESALRDLFDPSFAYSLRVTMSGDKIVIAWAGGSGEREYRCRFYATSERFVRREISQLDNQSHEVVVTKDL